MADDSIFDLNRQIKAAISGVLSGKKGATSNAIIAANKRQDLLSAKKK